MTDKRYRIWDSEEGCYRDGCSISCEDGVISSSWGKEKHNWTAEQYTGLNDASGWEIYEGDIVVGSYRIPPVCVRAVVEFYRGAFMLRTPGHHPDETSVYEAIEYLNIDVRGNIHENPELMR